MVEPVVNLELDPGGCEQIECRRRFELMGLPCHERLADEPGIGVQKLLIGRLLTVLAIEVASEAHPSATHSTHLK